MAANSYTGSGITSLVFGTAALTGYLVSAVTVSTVPNLVVSVQNDQGRVVTRRYDDKTTTISFDAVFNGASLPEAGETFTYDGETYEVTSVDEVRSNVDYKRVSISAVVSEYV